MTICPLLTLERSFHATSHSICSCYHGESRVCALTSRHWLPLKTLMSTTMAEAGFACTSKSLPHSASDVAPSVRSMVCRRGVQLRELRSRMWSRALRHAGYHGNPSGLKLVLLLHTRHLSEAQAASEAPLSRLNCKLSPSVDKRWPGRIPARKAPTHSHLQEATMS